MLFSSQEILKRELRQYLNSDAKYIVLKGKGKTGKSFLVKEVFTDFPNTLIFDRNEENDDIYAPFEKAARKASNVLISQAEDILTENREKEYSAPQFFLRVVDSINQSLKNKDKHPYFKPNEENYLSQISSKLLKQSKGQILEKKTIRFFSKNQSNDSVNPNDFIFLFEEINTWDNNSLILVKKIIEHGNASYPLISKAKIVFTLSNNVLIEKSTEVLIEEILRKSKAICLQMPKLSKKDFYNFIEKTEISFTNLSELEQTEMLSFLEEYSDDNFEEIPFMIVELYELIKDKNYDLIDKSIFYSSLQKKLADIEIPTKRSEEILQYASLMGNTFSSKEMKLVTDLSIDEFKSVIDRVLDIKVLKHAEIDENFSFASILFKELFKSKAQKQINQYYSKLEQIVNQLYPYRYDRRAKYLSNVWNATRKTQVLLFLSLLQRLRNRDEIDSSIQNQLNDEYTGYFFLFEKAYNFIDKNEYSQAREILNTIKYGSCNIPIKAECDILLAFCYSKTIDGELRKEGVELLEKYLENKELESQYSDIYERLLMRLFVMYVHMSQSEKANAIYDQLMLRFDSYDSDNTDIQVKKNTLLRISNTICEERISSYHIERAASFFESNQSYEKGTINYFIALCNYSGIMIENGAFDSAFNISLKAYKLTDEHESINFPRIHILHNNHLLSGYLSNKLNVIDCIDSYKKIISELPANAERLFLISNLSIFYSLNNQFDLALELLQKESFVHQTTKDSEGKYNERVMFNLSIFNFLLGKHEKAIAEMEKHLHQLHKSSGYEKNMEIKRAEQALKVMRKNNRFFDGEEWLEVLLKGKIVGTIKENKVNQNPDNYRQLGYMFTSLYNWDI